MAGATTRCTAAAFKTTSSTPSLTHHSKDPGHKERERGCWRPPYQRSREISRPASPPTAMPPWAASLLLLLLLLLLHSSGSLGGNMEIRGVGMEMDSEAHGRLLWEATTGSSSRRYISYDALRGDAVPCSRSGVPYYNCRITTTANPYTRGCESITRCRDAEDP